MSAMLFTMPRLWRFFAELSVLKIARLMNCSTLSYLNKHGENINTQKLSHAIQQLAVKPSNAKFLVDLAEDMPDPAFFPGC